MAEEHFLSAQKIIEAQFEVYTNIHMNLGNVEAQKKNYKAAIDHYEVVIYGSPHANPKAFAEKDPVLFSKHLNSFNAYVDAHTNIAVMYVQLDQF